MVICGCTPMAINVVHILAKNANADEASAIFNSTFSNIVGILLSPLLILGYLGITGDVDILNVFFKLLVRILLPLVVGQILQKTSKPIVQLMKRYKLWVKKAQIYALVFIVYTVFCQTFAKGVGVGIVSILLMVLFQFLLMIGLIMVGWYSMKRAFPSKPKLVATGILSATFKTVSVGVPLINAMYEGNENVGLYTLPLLIWHPMQLVVGSIMVPYVLRWVQSESERLGTDGDDDKSENITECVVVGEAEDGPEVVEQDLANMEAGGPPGERDEH
jgi:solute carrier family 10 (sodium/bile acid cotransporter), member 7